MKINSHCIVLGKQVLSSFIITHHVFVDLLCITHMKGLQTVCPHWVTHDSIWSTNSGMSKHLHDIAVCVCVCDCVCALIIMVMINTILGLFNSRQPTCTHSHTLLGLLFITVIIWARAHTHTHTHTLLKRAQCKLKAIVIPYGSCGSASQEACEKSRGACWAMGMWRLSCWPQSARQLWRSQLWALSSCCFSRWLYTRSYLWTVSKRGYCKWVRGESWVGFAWTAWTEFLKRWSIKGAETTKLRKKAACGSWRWSGTLRWPDVKTCFYSHPQSDLMGFPDTYSRFFPWLSTSLSPTLITMATKPRRGESVFVPTCVGWFSCLADR